MESVAYEEVLAKDGMVVTHVVGNSMMPLLRDRESIVVVEAVDRVPPRRGDVVLYKTGGTYILHRVLRVKEEEYLIRGDNTWTMEHIQKAALLATMTGFYRHPEDRLVSRENVLYRLYRVALPGVRWGRRCTGKAFQLVRKVCNLKLHKTPEK